MLHQIRQPSANVPAHRWVMTQTWTDLLFVHWPVPVGQICDLVPDQLRIDTYDRTAWISLVPFDIRQIRLKGLPPIPLASRFPQINLRTYVVVGGHPGVYFFSIDAAHRLAAAVSRIFLHLPFYNARIHLQRKGSEIRYSSRRTHTQAFSAEFRVSYRPYSSVFQAREGSLDHWLTDRYTLYTVHKRRLYQGDLSHHPWPLQYAEADISRNTMAEACKITLPDTRPVLHYASKMKAFICPLVKV
ncbi:YqjF family protein [Paenactinomyces guangxiensis]|uniref:DUF2071 domain-containing protein n=1 Tax=Paenactinomyces guangxiensis TaxID=1490290 RepID=A0A7W2A836_9BACL|nr:DUF2071 domain-containing protein [Paenactinomyces guangxiensis]MBA4493413.1 DUF2071 domain-containing protein [Paenactinomyces guangxiensis]MBH8590504.1 DUF2071 domain-containing protein [Paenactinomyces guangxiensis]